MVSNSRVAARTASQAALPTRLHHNAYVCSNQEKTRHFYEDVLGMPLLAAWIEDAELPEFPGRQLRFSHSFFGLEDGGALAFFNFADPEVQAFYTARKQPIFVHIALSVTDEHQKELKKRLMQANAFAWENDHGYCKSIYGYDPDGLLLEFTVDPPNVEEINAAQRRTAHETLRRWEAGDRAVNNQLRPHGH